MSRTLWHSAARDGHPLGRPADHDPPRRLHQTPVGLGLRQVRRRQARLDRDAVHAEEEQIEVERLTL